MYGCLKRLSRFPTEDECRNRQQINFKIIV
jgi:hypothetical protein